MRLSADSVSSTSSRSSWARTPASARELPNNSFQAKMAMLLVAVPLTVVLGHRLKRSEGRRADGVTRGLAVLLVLVWMFIISAARWIGYS